MYAIKVLLEYTYLQLCGGVLFTCYSFLQQWDAAFLLENINVSAWLKFLKYSWQRPRNFADTVFRRTKSSRAHIELYMTAVVEKSQQETSFFWAPGQILRLSAL